MVLERERPRREADDEHAAAGPEVPVLAAKVVPPEPTPMLRRRRLAERLRSASSRRLVLVVAPAGAGKTTLLRELAGLVEAPAAWYRADSADRTEAALLRHLREAVRRATGREIAPWRSLQVMIRDLERLGELLVVIDDLHALQGSPAMRAFARSVDYLPPNVTFAAASRTVPDINLSRLCVSGELLDIGADELRFRTWEIEALYRDVYDQALPPEESARLGQRTQGWAAGLQLYHLATRGKPPEARQRTLEALRSGGRLVAEYLTSNVLTALPEAVQDFLLETCILGTMTPRICDELRQADDSAELLEALHRQQVFTTMIDDAPTYRYHGVLRSHLEATLSERISEGELGERYVRAGKLLERDGLLIDAVRAYCHGRAWEAATGLVREGGARFTDPRRSHDWLSAVPESLIREDPWLRLAVARNDLAAGRFEAALSAYRDAEDGLRQLGAGEECARERHALAMWLGSEPVSGSGVWATLRRATQGEPLAVASKYGADSPLRAVVHGGIALMAGDAISASRSCNAARNVDPTPLVSAMAGVVAALADLLRGTHPDVSTLTALCDELDQLGATWVSRQVRSLSAISEPRALPWVRYLRDEQASTGNAWGVGAAGLIEGVAHLVHGRPDPEPLEAAIEAFQEADAPVPEAWAVAFLALTRVAEGSTDARGQADAAERLARRTDTPGALAVASVAGWALEDDDDRSAAYEDLATTLCARLGIDVHALERLTAARRRGPERTGSQRSEPEVELRCFGRFEMRVGTREIALDGMQPQLRRGMFLFAVNVGTPLHREQVAGTFWPDMDTDSAIHNVQVLISSLRKVLTGADPSGPVDIVRIGDTYTLELGPDADIDIVAFREAREEALNARLDQRADDEVRALRRLLNRYRGELVPEAGPSSWIERSRYRYNLQAVDGAARLGQLLLDRGQPRAAVEVCERGIDIDPFHDRLWRVLVAVYERLGDPASAAVARNRYADVLEELGFDSGSTSPAPHAGDPIRDRTTTP